MAGSDEMRSSTQTGQSAGRTLRVGPECAATNMQMTNRNTSELPILDEQAIAELEGALPGGNISSALATFAEELECRDIEIRNALAGSDHDALASIAHGIKGSAATFCAPALARAARLLEEKLPDNDAEQISAASVSLAAGAMQTARRVREFLAHRPGTCV